MSDKYIVELNRDIGDLTHCLAEKDKELKALREWKEKARRWLEYAKHIQGLYKERDRLYVGFVIEYNKNIDELTELLKDEL